MVKDGKEHADSLSSPVGTGLPDDSEVRIPLLYLLHREREFLEHGSSLRLPTRGRETWLAARHPSFLRARRVV